MPEASLRKPLFGKEVEIVVWGIGESMARGVLEDAYARGLMLQKIFNFYDRESALSRLNRARKLEAPGELVEVLKTALKFCEKTEGRYDVSLGKQFKERKGGKKVTPLGCSYRDIVIDGNRVELAHPDAMIDLGSIAKGYIADRIADFLREEGVISGLIDARGDMRAFGEHESVIEVQHPRDESKAVCSVALRDGGLATSGDYNQYDKTYDFPHIINKKDYISVTVLAPTLMEADAYASAIFVTPKEGVRSLIAGAGIKAFCIKNDLGIDNFSFKEFQ
ncbi:MAG TPA: FAD:protein FMN transferase [Candidatus Bilamarchaeum sp.]|nr:FAD:protein FMN transferase [Candidatus Bilamarchaeum sp.]